MLSTALIIGFLAVCAATVMNLYRLLVGPTMMDRVLAADTMVINAIALIILYGMQQQTNAYFESALLFAMFGFTSTVAYCRFVLRGDIIE